MNNAGGDVSEEDHVEHNVVEAHHSTEELHNIDLDYNCWSVDENSSWKMQEGTSCKFQ